MLCQQAQADYQDFNSCLADHGCYLQSTDQGFYDCLNANCLDPYFKCFAGDEYKT
jgi:hypothetical protein